MCGGAGKWGGVQGGVTKRGRGRSDLWRHEGKEGEGLFLKARGEGEGRGGLWKYEGKVGGKGR